MTKAELKALAAHIAAASEAGRLAGEAQPDDGGSANLDRVVIPMKRIREQTVKDAGLPGYLQERSTWHERGLHLPAPSSGQGNRRSAAVKAQCDALKAAGVDCYIYYQMD